MQGRTTAEMERGRRGHDSHVSSIGDRGERHGDVQGKSNDESEGWSGGSEGGSFEDTEEDRMAAGEMEGSRDTLTASP